jgi:hypothetical protein
VATKLRTFVKEQQPKITKANPTGISESGQQMSGIRAGDRITSINPGAPMYDGQGFKKVPLGNELTTNVGKGGPGKGYVLYGKSGTQQQYGPSAPAAKDYSVDAPATAPSQRSLSEKGRVG